jgi:far upstream element-binding protein
VPFGSSAPPTLDSFVMEIPQPIVGLIIGRGGDKIKELQDQSGASIQVAREEDHAGKEYRPVSVIGTTQQCAIARQAIQQIVREVRG